MDSNASEKKSGEERDLTEGLLMRVIVLTNGKPECKEVPLPLPLQGEVLIKVFASQVSEGDLTFSKNPSLCGFSGSGLVIASGGGWFSNWNIVNTRVAFISNSKGNYGTWAEYIVLPAQYSRGTWSCRPRWADQCIWVGRSGDLSYHTQCGSMLPIWPNRPKCYI